MKQLFLTFICCQLTIIAMAQSTVITPGGSQPIIYSNTTSNGIQLPKLSPQNIVAIPSPSAGLMVYDTTCKCPRYFNGTGWVALEGDVANPLDINQTVYVIGDVFHDLHSISTLKALDANTGLQKWVVEFYNASTSPIVANGILYIGTYGGGLTAYDAATGTFRWNFSPGISHTAYSSPVVVNGVIYLGFNGNLYAVDATTGTQKWSFIGGFITYSCPVVANGVVYIGSNDGNLYAVDATTGTQRWSFATGNRVYSTPAVSNGVVYVVTEDGKLYAIDEATGALKWTFDTHYMISSPTVENGVVYVEGVVFQGGSTTSGDKNLYAIYASTGVEKWSFALGNNFNVNNVTLSKNSSPIVAEGVVYAASGVLAYGYGGYAGNLYAIDANTGTQKWQFAPTNTFFTPTVANGIIYVETGGGYLYAIDANTGTQKWQSGLGNNTFNFSPCVVTSLGKVYRGIGNIHP
jgi:eukaryotic-like serine/threonine-protein kinase